MSLTAHQIPKEHVVTNIIIGAIFGFLSAIVLRWWQYRRDFWLDRINECCEAIDACAQAGADYWYRDAPKPEDDIIPNDARVLGLLMRIEGFYASLFSGKYRSEQLERLLDNFRDALTGGDFYGALRTKDLDRARLIQMYASELMIAIWQRSDELASLSWIWRQACGTCQNFLSALNSLIPGPGANGR